MSWHENLCQIGLGRRCGGRRSQRAGRTPRVPIFSRQRRSRSPRRPRRLGGEWNKLQPADKVMDAVGIEPGMVVAEFGAGKGRYAVQVAARVGAKGRCTPRTSTLRALEYLKTRCARDTISNIETVLGDATDPKLPPASCDFVYCINTYHHIDEPVPLLRNIIPALNPWAARDHRAPARRGQKKTAPRRNPRSRHRDGAAAEAGYELVARHSFLELDEIYVFRAATRRHRRKRKRNR